MRSKQSQPMDEGRSSGIPQRDTARDATTTAIVVSGAVAGAVLGSIAGPIGAVLGGVVGAGAGIAAGVIAADKDELRTVSSERYDAEVGVVESAIGQAQPDQPAAIIGAYSAGSAGGGGAGSDDAPDEGPMPRAEA